MYNIIGFVLALILFIFSLVERKPNFAYVMFMFLFAMVKQIKQK